MELTKEQRKVLSKWIKENLMPTSKTNYNVDTSEIRESFMSLYIHGFYIDNYTMNKILRECGFVPSQLSHDPYLRWNISSKSRAIQIYRSSLGGQLKDWMYE